MRIAWAKGAADRLAARIDDPRKFLERALGDAAGQRLKFAVGASETKAEGAALVLASAEAAEAQGLTVRARILGHASHAQAPGWFTTAPVPAAQKLLKNIGWQVEDVDLWEVNEAFAVVPMAFMHEMGLPRDKVNVNGGACALGHPIGASGARIMVTLLNALEKRGLKRGVAAICIGGGEGTAIAIERA